MSFELYVKSSYNVSKLITRQYSTSFSIATSLLESDTRRAIYAVYGFVRLADEVVDSFHGYDKPYLLEKLKDDLYYAIENGVSTNPVLMSFADTVRNYNLLYKHIDAFLASMRNDITDTIYVDQDKLNDYIYGSADVVGLMCLKVFCKGDEALYEKLEYPAQKLGSAFQKVNFIRDLRDDLRLLNRSYFPEITQDKLDRYTKRLVEQSIDGDFIEAKKGISELPGRSRLAVALAYYYYRSLFRKIKRTAPEKLIQRRVRISNVSKYLLIAKVSLMYKTKLI